jgi:hypothetical protein
MTIIDFKDEEDTYGRIETEENPDIIEKLLDEYRNLDYEEYNIDDFLNFLRNDKEIDFTRLNIDADISIHF